MDDVLDYSGDIDVYVIHGEKEQTPAIPSTSPRPRQQRFPFIISSVIVAMTGLLAALSRKLHLADAEANTVMLFLASVAYVAYQYGRRPATLASVLAVMVLDFFFVPPFYTFTIADVRYVVTFWVMLAIGLAISTLTSRLKSMVERTRLREQRTAAQYELGKLLSSLYGNVFLVSAAGERIAEMLGGEVAIFLDGSDDGPPEVAFETTELLYNIPLVFPPLNGSSDMMILQGQAPIRFPMPRHCFCR